MRQFKGMYHILQITDQYGGNPSDGIREERNCESCHCSFAPRPHPHPVWIALISLLMTAYHQYAITEGKAWYISHMTNAKNGKGSGCSEPCTEGDLVSSEATRCLHIKVAQQLRNHQKPWEPFGHHLPSIAEPLLPLHALQLQLYCHWFLLPCTTQSHSSCDSCHDLQLHALPA